MGAQEPWMLVVLIGGTAYAARLWLADLRATGSGRPVANPLPGASPSTRPAVALACVGALVLLAVECGGEYALGIVARQTQITVLFGIYTLAAAFLEELVFRGHVVLLHRGRAVLIVSCLAASAVFALLHPFLWEWREGSLHWRADTKAWFSTAMIFAGSLWFYSVRFWKLNPTHSLLPCIAAHAVKNVGVFAVKYCQGFVSGWW